MKGAIFLAEVIDIFDIFEDEGVTPERSEHDDFVSADEALIMCTEKYGAVDLDYIADLCGLSPEEAASRLRGAIFQDPEPFLDRDGIGAEEYSISAHWVHRVKYGEGNLLYKLEAAERACELFPGRFESCVEYLRSMMPERVSIDDIYISPGASFVPTAHAAEFLKSFLELKKTPKVCFYPDVMTYDITVSDEDKDSVLNTITYGVRGEVKEGRFTYEKQYTTAVALFEQAMNARTAKIFDYKPKPGWYFEYEQVLNKQRTVEAQDKQKLLLDAFDEFERRDPGRVRELEECYNEKLVGYVRQSYDGAFLSLPGINREVKLYPHQRDAIARILLSGSNVLLDHDVGTGKTYVMNVAAHELYRMGISRKNLVVVPNNVLRATVNAHKLLYKDDKILAIYPADFTPAKRAQALESIQNGDYTAIYMAYSSFDMIVMSKEYYVSKFKSEIRALGASIYNTKNKKEKKRIESKRRVLEKRLKKFEAEAKVTPWLTYEKLGITTLFVDEAHNYKNIPIETRADSIVGMGGASKKCKELLEKAHNTERVVFATGTPLTNSLADLYAFQLYLQPETLRFHNIHTFDRWVSTFGQRETAVECDVEQGLRSVSRFSSFHNLSELTALFSQISDFHRASPVKGDLPDFNGYTDVVVPMSRSQRAYYKSLAERVEAVRKRKVSRTEDNLLKITNDGRNAALDIRLVDGDVPFDPDEPTKTAACAKRVIKLYLEHPGTVQIVFSDIGTPKASFNIYDELLRLLVEGGIPRSEIAFVHDATTESARAKLFERMNSGELRVVIGSTPKLGVGVNVQKKLIAIHHLSVPWRPADMVQREGRLLRRGNTSGEVFILRYLTEGSFDAYLWQILENKQKFISSFLSGTSAERDAEDIADAVLTYAEIKALAIGNPLIKNRVEVANKLERTRIACRTRQREMRQHRAVIDSAPARRRELEAFARLTLADYKRYKAEKTVIPRDERAAFGEELLYALKHNADVAFERAFDDYRGFTVKLPANMNAERAHVYLESSAGGRYYCKMETDAKTPIGCTMALDYLLEHLYERYEGYMLDIEQLERQVSEAEAGLSRENPFFKELELIKAELEEIDRKLAEAA